MLKTFSIPLLLLVSVRFAMILSFLPFKNFHFSRLSATKSRKLFQFPHMITFFFPVPDSRIDDQSTTDSDVIPFWDGGLDSNLSFSSSESMGVWVPQAASVTVNPPQNQNQWFPTSNISFGGQIGSKDILTVKSSRKWNDENIFAVPQINPHSTASKRLRTLC